MSDILSVDYFEFCSKMLYFTNALAYCYEFYESYRTACGKDMKFGTQTEDSLIINHSKFGVSNSNSLVPPIGQICTHVSANNLNHKI